MLQFRNLKVGVEFEFDHSELPVACYSFAHGPWIKISARKYARVNGTVDETHRIGSTRAAVSLDGSCHSASREAK